MDWFTYLNTTAEMYKEENKDNKIKLHLVVLVSVIKIEFQGWILWTVIPHNIPFYSEHITFQPVILPHYEVILVSENDMVYNIEKRRCRIHNGETHLQLTLFLLRYNGSCSFLSCLCYILYLWSIYLCRA